MGPLSLTLLGCHPTLAAAIQLLLAACAPVALSAESQKKGSFEGLLKRLGYELVEMERTDDHSLNVRGTINGRKEVFLVDTGWSFTTIKPGVAKRLKTLGDLGVKLEDTFWGKLEDPSIAIIDTLVFGRARFLNQPARVKEIDFEMGRFAQNGALGYDFLNRNSCLVDCAYRRLYVRGNSPPADVRSVLDDSLRLSGFIEVPLRMEFDRVITCEAKANGEPVRLLVDTGGVFSVFDVGQVARLQLSRHATGLSLQGVGKIGTHDLQTATLKTLELQNLTLTNLSFGVANLRAWGIANKANGSEPVHGILGAEYLCNLGSVIDCRGLKLWLKPIRKGN